MTKKIRTNPNGNLAIEELVEMVHDGSITEYMKNFKLTTDKCPPYKLINSTQVCTYCTQCQFYCIDQVKECKNHYKVGKVKFMKEDLDE